MNYSYSNQTGAFDSYYVVETQTGQIIADTLYGDEVRGFTSYLNGGGFFDGWTPAFFFNELDLDDEVS